MNTEWIGELVELLGVEDAADWLASPCDELDGEIPLELCRDGEQERVAEVVSDMIHRNLEAA